MKEELRETINEIAKELEKLKEGETFRFEVTITKSDVNLNNEAVKVKIKETEDFIFTFIKQLKSEFAEILNGE